MSVYESPTAVTQHPYLAALRQWWPILVGGALIGALLGWGVSQAAIPSYRSTATLYFSLSAGDSGNDLNQGSTYTQSQMLSFAELATSDTVLAPAIQALDLDVTPR
jgi:succinoglycan biosynthesis transport protein ExoP